MIPGRNAASATGWAGAWGASSSINSPSNEFNIAGGQAIFTGNGVNQEVITHDRALGSAVTVGALDTLTIDWPDGTQTVQIDVAADGVHTVMHGGFGDRDVRDPGAPGGRRGRSHEVSTLRNEKSQWVQVVENSRYPWRFRNAIASAVLPQPMLSNR